ERIRITQSRDGGASVAVTDLRYNTAGHLVHQAQLNSGANNPYAAPREQFWRYDAAGRVIVESYKEVAGGKDLGWTQSTRYDAAGRIEEVSGDGIQMRYWYDGADNRRVILGASGANGSWSGVARWNTYDELGRTVITGGQLDASNNIAITAMQTQYGYGLKPVVFSTEVASFVNFGSSSQRSINSRQFSYLGSGGQQTSATSLDALVAGNHIEHYRYDGFGQLLQIQLQTPNKGTLLQTRRQLDYAGRVVVDERRKDDGSLLQRTHVRFDADGRALQQESYDHATAYRAELTEKERFVDNTGKVGRVYYQYTHAQGQQSITDYSYRLERTEGYTAYLAGGGTDSYTFTYAAYQRWQQTTQDRVSTIGEGAHTKSITTYNIDGAVIHTEVPFGDAHGLYTQNRRHTVDLQGRILDKFDPHPHVDYVGSHVRFAFAGGAAIASTGGYGESIFDMQNASPSLHRLGSSSTLTYVVANGDTLQSVAAAVWGDTSLWYLIAEENGLATDPSARLQTGISLKLPDVTSPANRADTFKPYNPGEIVGDTTPGLPP
ncbi:hypothetical protein, partial [Chitinimonas sp. JJ19]|uniref:hypothetical protein n=1 Tax=Chitinimonas sp. JJ19 TaxID=3109352 RepID=UPI003002B8E5